MTQTHPHRTTLSLELEYMGAEAKLRAMKATKDENDAIREEAHQRMHWTMLTIIMVELAAIAFLFWRRF